jgi:chemotaxis protein methyltransferase CheR
VNPILLQDFIQLIANHTGMQVQDRDRIELVKKLESRVLALKLSSTAAYYQLLSTAIITGTRDAIALERARAQEWEALTLLLTTGETYFFRDRGQLDLIQEVVLPEIIHRKMLAQEISKARSSLRIWSAGSSTGEEVYSLATIVQETIPNYLNWNLKILGTDINTESIAKAKVGNYSEWSFRMVSGDIKRKYFKNENKNWQLNEQIRRMVEFRAGNLLTDNYPSINSDIYNMDLIICRNVFIYFNAKNVETILAKFYQTLSPGGYLIVGHTELNDLNLQGFVPRAFEKSVIYQRSEDIQPESHTCALPNPKTPAFTRAAERISKKIASQPINKQTHKFTSSYPTEITDKLTTSQLSLQSRPQSNKIEKSENLNLVTELEKAQSLFDKGEYTLSLQKVEILFGQQPNNFEVIFLLAQIHGNLGEYQKAIYYCNLAIAHNSMSVKLYHLLAHIAEAEGNLTQAKEYLKKIIYIDETAIAAYLDLGTIYKIDGDDRRAEKMMTIATELLEALPPDSTIHYRGQAMVSELLAQINP